VLGRLAAFARNDVSRVDSQSPSGRSLRSGFFAWSRSVICGFFHRKRNSFSSCCLRLLHISEVVRRSRRTRMAKIWAQNGKPSDSECRRRLSRFLFFPGGKGM
jgi:hypothetical protein